MPGPSNPDTCSRARRREFGSWFPSPGQPRNLLWVPPAPKFVPGSAGEDLESGSRPRTAPKLVVGSSGEDREIGARSRIAPKLAVASSGAGLEVGSRPRTASWGLPGRIWKLVPGRERPRNLFRGPSGRTWTLVAGLRQPRHLLWSPPGGPGNWFLAPRSPELAAGCSGEDLKIGPATSTTAKLAWAPRKGTGKLFPRPK